ILELYLEIFGLEHIRRALYKAGGSLKVRYDDRLVSDLENAVGPGLVRLLGHRGATTRIDPTTTSSTGQRPRNDPLSAALADSDVEAEILDSADREALGPLTQSTQKGKRRAADGAAPSQKTAAAGPCRSRLRPAIPALPQCVDRFRSLVEQRVAGNEPGVF